MYDFRVNHRITHGYSFVKRLNNQALFKPHREVFGDKAVLVNQVAVLSVSLLHNFARIFSSSLQFFVCPRLLLSN